MRQRDDDRLLSVAIADAFFERARTEKTRDRELPDRDDDLRSQEPKLIVEPVRAVGDSPSRRRQVATVLSVAARKAPHQRGDVSLAAKVLGVPEPGAHHPPVKLLACAAREWPPR